jgi:hypothetical protein
MREFSLNSSKSKTIRAPAAAELEGNALKAYPKTVAAEARGCRYTESIRLPEQ